MVSWQWPRDSAVEKSLALTQGNDEADRLAAGNLVRVA